MNINEWMNKVVHICVFVCVCKHDRDIFHCKNQSDVIIISKCKSLYEGELAEHRKSMSHFPSSMTYTLKCIYRTHQKQKDTDRQRQRENKPMHKIRGLFGDKN